MASVPLFLFSGGCREEIDKRPTSFAAVSNYLGGECYEVSYRENKMRVNIINSPVIKRARQSGSPMFSYQQYASICALMISKNDFDNIYDIDIVIQDDQILDSITYNLDEVRQIEKKISVDHEFGQAMVANNRKAAMQYFSDTIRSLPGEKINEYFFDNFFSYGKVTKVSLVAFVIAEHTVGVYIDYQFDGRLSQSFIFIHERGRNSHKIVNIKMPALPDS